MIAVNKISACLVIRNEEKVLERCLDSIKNIVTEIIVAHDGVCSDKSLEISQKYGAKIYIQEFIGEAEYHRPFTFQSATGDWILQIDADEFLSLVDQKKIHSLVKDKDVDGYQFSWPYFTREKYISTGPFSQTYKPCLFRKSKMFMIGISHEYPRTIGRMASKKNIHLIHKPLYNNYTWKMFQKKWIPWARLQAKQIYFLENAPLFHIDEKKKSENPLYQHYVFMRKYPLLSTIVDAFKFIFIYLSRGILFAGISSMKIALFELLYIWLVNYYIFVYKYEKRI